MQQYNNNNAEITNASQFTPIICDTATVGQKQTITAHLASLHLQKKNRD